jgi:hypothetical protein
VCDHRHGRSTDIAGSNTTDFHGNFSKILVRVTDRLRRSDSACG